MHLGRKGGLHFAAGNFFAVQTQGKVITQGVTGQFLQFQISSGIGSYPGPELHWGLRMVYHEIQWETNPNGNYGWNLDIPLELTLHWKALGIVAPPGGLRLRTGVYTRELMVFLAF